MLFNTFKPWARQVLRTLLKEVASRKALCELLVNVDGLKVTSTFVTSLVRFANISKHLVFQGRISSPCLLFLFSWVCSEDVELDLTWSPWQHTLVSMATHFTNSSTTLLQCQTKGEARLLEQAVTKVKIKKRGKGGNTGRGWVRWWLLPICPFKAFAPG